MNRQQAKVLLPIIQAFAEGKTVEYCYNDNWIEQENYGFMDNVRNYLIKPESKYRPFANTEECWQEMLRHKPFGWVKYRKAFISLITQVSLNCVSIGKNYYFKEAREVFTFADGTPFGIKEEE